MAAPQQQGGGTDHSSGILWTVAACFGAIGLIWYAFKDYIVNGYLYVKLHELYFLEWLGLSQLDELQTKILQALSHPKVAEFKVVADLGGQVGEYFRIGFVVLFLILAVIVYWGNSTRSFKRIYNMDSLAKLEKENWPQISPVMDLNLIKTNIDTGPWSMAMTPMQFCKRNKLLEEVRRSRHEGMTRKERERIDVLLKRGEANKLFALQLGALWKGTEVLPPHIKGLFAVFAARINADSSEAARLLAQFSVSPIKKLNMNGVDALLKKHENTPLVKKITQSHAYVFSVMASMLEAARSDGVQASADFLWLKVTDRRLWYTLNTVGRQTPFVEVAGIYAHWISEKEAGKKLLVPMVEEASKALEGALKEIVYRPDL